MTAFRTMGKSIFLDIRDGSDRMQVYAQKNALGDESFEVLKKLDLGRFYRREGDDVHDAHGGDHAQDGGVHRRRQGAAAAPGQVARPLEHRDALPPALPRPHRQRRRQAGLLQAQRDYPRDSRLHARARLHRGRDANDAGDPRWRGGAAVRHSAQCAGLRILSAYRA